MQDDDDVGDAHDNRAQNDANGFETEAQIILKRRHFFSLFNAFHMKNDTGEV